MKTPPAPMYATLYFAIHEINTVPLFPQLKYYGRYIDDVLAIWEPHPDIDNQQVWIQFQDQINSYGKLKWEASHLFKSVNFLDLTVSIAPDLTIETKLFEKALKLYLYLPPHSAHPPGVLKGLIAGMIHRIFRLNSNKSNIKPALNDFYKRLRARGYTERTLRPLFTRYIEQVACRLIVESTKGNTANCLFLHVPYHPCDPPSQALQKCFANAMLQPLGEPPLADLQNNDNVCFNHSRMIVAFHRSRNLGNLLSPRRVRLPNQPVKIQLDKNISTTNNVACDTYSLVQNPNKNSLDSLVTGNTPTMPTDEEKSRVN